MTEERPAVEPNFYAKLARPFEEADLAAAAVAAAGVERLVSGTLDDLGSAMLKAASVEQTERVDTLVRLDGLILTLEIAPPAAAAQWGQPFAPARLVDDHPFQVRDVTDEARGYLDRRAAEATRRDAAARYLDFIWSRWRHFPALIPAIDAYLEFAESERGGEFEQAMAAEQALARASRLALEFNHRRLEVSAAAAVAIRQWTTADYLGLVTDLVEAAAPIISIDQEPARELGPT